MAQIGTVGTGDLGNTSSKSQCKKCRKWCFTVNNWLPEDSKRIIDSFGTVAQWILGEEVGESGTPHLQGFLCFKNAVSFKTIKKAIPKGHIEPARGSVRQNYDYCSKDGKFTTNIDFRTFKEKLKDECLKEYKDVVWKDWQQQVLDLKNDARSINWFWEGEGNVGKSFVCKYLALTRDVVICEGKKADIFNQVNTLLEKEKMPKVVICDIPRSAIDYINYGALEQLKGGLLYSGKYEGGVCVFPPPLVICFANTPPDLTSMSADRWNVVEVCEGKGG